MSRRKAYSALNKTNQIRAEHVKGMGDTVFRVFQCINPNCTEMIFVKNDDVIDDFSISCPKCGYLIEYGGETKFYDYSMDVKDSKGNINTVSTGEFTIYHEDYINESMKYKYCIVCNTLKPLNFFDKHSARNSGHQGECKLCKKIYNDIKNGTRITDQHRESSQKRRLYLDLAGNKKINSEKIEEKYLHKCFNCGKDLSNENNKKEKPLDHTLPAYYLWPLSTENATLLCRTCNGQKSGKWPSNFYNQNQLKKLSILTGFDYSLLSGNPQYNPEALKQLHNSEIVDSLLEKYAAYIDEIIKLRNRILLDIGYDFFSVSKTISQRYIEIANELLQK